jgi:hypothetical protein
MVTSIRGSATENGDCAGSYKLPDLLEKLVKQDGEFIKPDDIEGHYQVRIKGTWMVVDSVYPDDFDFMRLDRALRLRINERGWHYGLGLMSSAVLCGRLARICIPCTGTRSVQQAGEPYISHPIWIWESHKDEDAIALLRAYVQGLEKIEELVNANHAA